MMFGHGLVRKMKTAEFCFRPAKDSLVKINVSYWSHRVEQIRIYTHNKYLQSWHTTWFNSRGAEGE